MESFHDVPAIVPASLAIPWLEVDRFVLVLADICYGEPPVFLSEGNLQGFLRPVAQTSGLKALLFAKGLSAGIAKGCLPDSISILSILPRSEEGF
jgi:hypothetical protein